MPLTSVHLRCCSTLQNTHISPNVLLIDENADSAIHRMPYPCLFLPSLYIFKLLLYYSIVFLEYIWFVLFLTDEFFLTLMTGTHISFQSIKIPKIVFGIITPICQYLFDGMLFRNTHRPTLLTSFHHKHLLLLHSLILSSLSLCLRLQMYFDKSFPHSFFILPFVKYPFTSVCYLDTSAVNCYHYVVSFWIYVWVQVYLYPFYSSTRLLWNLVLSPWVSLYELTSFLESLLIDGMEVGTHVRWRAAISRNSDSDSEGLPFLCSFSLALLASPKKPESNNISPLLTRDSLYSLQFIFLFGFFSSSHSFEFSDNILFY